MADKDEIGKVMEIVKSSLKLLLDSGLVQGRLKIWTEHSTLILLISKLFEVALLKF